MVFEAVVVVFADAGVGPAATAFVVEIAGPAVGPVAGLAVERAGLAVVRAGLAAAHVAPAVALDVVVEPAFYGALALA